MIEEGNPWPKKRASYFVAAALLFFLGIYFYLNVQGSGSDIKTDDLQFIDSLVINEGPAFKESKGRHSRRWIEFKCIGYAKRFEIGYFDSECVSEDELLQDLHVGDTISVAVLKTDFESRYEETFNSKSNDIHSLVFQGYEYIDIDCRNETEREDERFGYYMCFIMTAFILLMTFLINRFPMLINYFDTSLVLGIIGILVMLILRFYVFDNN